MDLTELPLIAFSEIPKAKPDAKEITALVKESGKVVGYQLSDDRVIDKDQAIAMARKGHIADVGIALNKGNEYLKSLPDVAEGNNLSSLPSISNN